MSMAGGWFFLTVNEAFTLGRPRLPPARHRARTWPSRSRRATRRAMAWAIVAMIVMIVAVDQLLWRPLVAWSQRFRDAEVAGEDAPRVVGAGPRPPLGGPPPPAAAPAQEAGPAPRRPSPGSARGRAAGEDAGARASAPRCSSSPRRRRGRGARSSGRGSSSGSSPRVPPREWLVLAGALGATFLRTVAALALAVALDAAGRNPRRPLAVVVAAAPARRPDRRVVPGADALPARDGRPPRAPRAVRASIAAVLMLLGAQWYVLFNVLAGASADPARPRRGRRRLRRRRAPRAGGRSSCRPSSRTS